MPEDLATPSGSVKKKTDMEETMNNNTDKASPSPLDSMEENTLPTPFSSSSSSKYKIPTSSPSFLHSTYPRTTTPSFTSKSKFTASTSNIEPLISHLHHLLKELKQHHQFTSSTQENYLVLQKKQALHTQLCTQKYQDHVHQLTTYQETLKTIMVLLQCDTIDSVVPTIAALQHQVAHQSEQLLEIQSTLDSIEVEWHRISNDGKLLQANVQHLQSITDQNKLDYATLQHKNAVLQAQLATVQEESKSWKLKYENKQAEMEISSEQRYKDRIRFLETQLYDQQRNESQKLSTLHEKVLELQCQNGALLRRWDPQIKNDWEIKKRLSRFLI